MKYKIIGDSCCDFTKEDLKKEYVVSIPLTLIIGEKEFVDDESFQQGLFLDEMEAYSDCAKSACPSPQAYMEAYKGADEVYVITLSSRLSGSYNSAITGVNMYLEENPDAKVHVFDSKSAAAGQNLIYKKIEALKACNKEFDEIVKEVDLFVEEMRTIFVLDDLDNLRKNGRLSKMKSIVASVLNIKPVLHALDGEILQLGKARGSNKALIKLCDYFGEVMNKYQGHGEFVISHCACEERAKWVKEMLEEKYHIKDITILETRGVSTLYASRGGIIVVY